MTDHDDPAVPAPVDPAVPDAAALPRSVRGTGRRLYGAIANKLGTAIMSGEYPPGAVLPAEIAFSGELGVSRGAYREAMQVLIAKGLVESRPKAGTRVLQQDRWNLLDPDVLAWAFAGNPDIAYVRSLFELRAIVEPAAARLAAERRSRDDLRTMKDALAAMRRHTLATDQGRAADRDFHNAILRATQNGALVTLSASIGAAVGWTTQFKQRARALPRNPVPDHVRVYDMIAAGDGDGAAEAMRLLVELALDDTKSAMEG
jgi:DNA-binding FadR family transcriptional regulator